MSGSFHRLVGMGGWVGWKWGLECLVQTSVERLAGMLPGVWVYRMGEFLGVLAWYGLPSRRRTVLRNLRIVHGPDRSWEELQGMAKRNFRRTAANLISVAHTAGLRPERLKEVMRVENLELVEHALAEGKGVVLLLCHMGNWEMLSRLVHVFPPGTRTGAFYRPLNNPILDEQVRRRREMDGTRMFSKRESPWQVASYLREGAVVGILADQRVGPQGEVVEFFGRRTRGSSLPALMAKRGRSELLALSLRTERPGCWVVRFERVVGSGSAADSMAAIESAMRRSLEDVFWLQDRWKVYPVAGGFAAWLPGEAGRSHKPHRGLVWMVGGVPARLGERMAGWLHPDLDLELVVGEDDEVPEFDWVVKVHRAPVCRGFRGLVRLLDEVDRSAGLPLDLVFGFENAPAELRKAAKRVQAMYLEM